MEMKRYCPLFLLLVWLCIQADGLSAGSSLSLIPCSSGSSALVSAIADGTVRNSDGSLCATYVGASPLQLAMLPCHGGSNQSWSFNAATSSFEGEIEGSCLAFNTQGDEEVPTRPVSTWTCSDLQWNGYFYVDSGGHIIANCSTVDGCGAFPSYCVGSTFGRVLSLSTVVRYWTVETTRTTHLLYNESALHTVAACEAFRSAVAAGWPGATVSWAFSWIALNTDEAEYPAIRALVASYVTQYGDEFTFIPGGYFAPMYNTESQTNQDIHDALALIATAVGGGYRPRGLIAGYLGAASLAYLAEVEGIHVAQATIFSQFNIDYGDGDGGSPYPYYPSVEHYLKPAQTASDLLDVVVLDGWTVDFLAARRDGFADGFNSRMGVGPIETIGKYGPLVGFEEQMHATSQHFDTGFAINGGEAYVSSIWEISLSQSVNVSYLTSWLTAVRAQWPDVQAISHAAAGLKWRELHPSNDYNYSFVEVGSGIGGSDADKEITVYVNRAFRLALLRNLTDPTVGLVIDFTRYDLPAAEPTNLTRSWNLMNELNWKQSRAGGVDDPRPLQALPDADQSIIKTWLPTL